MQSEVFSGARAVFKLNNKPVGYAVNTSGTTGINYQPIQVLGHLEVVEHVPTAFTVEMTASLARLARFTRLNQGQSFPTLRQDVEGSDTSPQIMPAFGEDGLNILQSGELVATIFDVVTKTTLYTISGLKASQKAWDIQAAGMVAENISFVARLSNENGESLGTIGQ